MLTKCYLGVGVFLCLGLGIAFAMDWKAPDLGMTGGGSGGGRGFFFHSSGGGYGFGK